MQLLPTLFRKLILVQLLDRRWPLPWYFLHSIYRQYMSRAGSGNHHALISEYGVWRSESEFVRRCPNKSSYVHEPIWQPWSLLAHLYRRIRLGRGHHWEFVISTLRMFGESQVMFRELDCYRQLSGNELLLGFVDKGDKHQKLLATRRNSKLGPSLVILSGIALQCGVFQVLRIGLY